MADSNTAPIKWAQRSDSLYLTIALPDVTDESIELTDSKLEFKGKSGGKDYEVNIEFFKDVDSSPDKGSTYKVLPRSVHLYIKKKEDDQEEFWPRLLKDKLLEKNQVMIDWDRYVDEDEENEGFDTSALEGGMGLGGGGMGGMEGMGGMGGMGGMDMEALMKQMGGMGGMPEGMDGLGGDDDDYEDEDAGDEADEDNEGLPDLEEVN